MPYTENQIRVIDATYECFAIAQAKYPNMKLDVSHITFDMNGRAAGMAYPRRNLLRYNTYITENAIEDMVKETVPHEVAHIVTWKLHPCATSHGWQWRGICIDLGGNGARCHNNELDPDRRRRQTNQFLYRCGCCDHYLGAKRHDRMRNYPGSLICRKCKGTLKFTGVHRLKPLS